MPLRPHAPSGRWLLVAVRTAFALLGLSALVTEVATLVERGRFVPENFFSYFTIESNALTVVVLLVAAMAAAAGARGRRLDAVRGATALYMTTVGLVFAVLLSHRPASELTAVPWDNTVLHYVLPVVVLLDWLLSGREAAVPFWRALPWLAVPLAYAVYSLVRGSLTGWYPYPFLDPTVSGYGSVLLTCAVLAVVLVVLTWLVATGPRWVRPASTARDPRRGPSGEADPGPGR